MAVGIDIASVIARSALAMLETTAYQGTAWVQTGAPSLQAAVARRLSQLYATTPGVSSQQNNAIARDVIRAHRAGMRMAQDPGRVLARTDLPVDRTLLPTDPRYRYQAIVTRTGPDGASQEYRTDVDSDVPLSANQVETLIRMTHDENYTPEHAGRTRQAYVGPGAVITAEVISAGRRA